MSDITMSLHYAIRPHNDDQIAVQLTARSNKDVPTSLSLFLGKVHITALSCNVPYHTRASVLVTAPTPMLELQYIVSVGAFQKHGKNGFATKEELCFCGEQLFLYPTELLTCDNEIACHSVQSLHVSFSGAQNHLFAPFASNRSVTAHALVWSDCFELMKSPFLCVNASRFERTYESGMFSVYRDASVALSVRATQGMQALYTYFCALFRLNDHPLTIVCTTSGQFVGSGRHLMAFGFDEHRLRDWQLLAHRMFHSFMDTALPYSAFRMPNNIWLTEALATFYENHALTQLPHTMQTALCFDEEKERQQLFARYLFVRLSEDERFAVSCEGPAHLAQPIVTEYAHYTYAPLLLHFLCVYNDTSPSQVIEHLCNNRPFKTTTSLFQQSESWAQSYAQYVQTPTLLPLWTSMGQLHGEPDVIKAFLLAYTQLLQSWGVFTPRKQQVAHIDASLLTNLRHFSLALYEMLFDENK